MSPGKCGGPLGEGQCPCGMKHLEGFLGFIAVYLYSAATSPCSNFCPFIMTLIPF